MQNGKHNLGWLIVGMALGATLGILFAPRTGKETRAALRQRLVNLRERYQPSGAEGHRDVASR